MKDQLSLEMTTTPTVFGFDTEVAFGTGLLLLCFVTLLGPLGFASILLFAAYRGPVGIMKLQDIFRPASYGDTD